MIGLSTAKWAEDVVNFDFFTQSLADAVVFFSSRPCATKGTKSSAKTAGKGQSPADEKVPLLIGAGLAFAQT